MAGIYLTLGLAGQLAEFLNGHFILGLFFGAGFFLVLLAIAGSGLHIRMSVQEGWAILGITAVYIMVFVRMGVPPLERTHLFEYGLVAVLLYQALQERRTNGKNVPVPAVLAILITAALGWFDEAIQGWLPNRVYDIQDVGINAFAAVMAVAASWFLSRIRYRH